jgi:hypothetical protein
MVAERSISLFATTLIFYNLIGPYKMAFRRLFLLQKKMFYSDQSEASIHCCNQAIREWGC